MKPFLSVIMPMFNEERNLERGVLDEVENYLKQKKFTSEVIISDDGSTDQSASFVNKYVKTHSRFKLLRNPHAGKPFAVRSGIKASNGEIVLFTDMDQSTPLREVEKLLPFFEKNDVVIGSRGQTRRGFSFFRLLASNVFRIFRQIILLPGITDTQCGFKAFKGEVAKDLFNLLLIFGEVKKTKGWRVGAFDVELLFIAQKRGYKIAEVPVVWQDENVAGVNYRKFIKESSEMLKEILRVKLNDLRGNYN